MDGDGVISTRPAVAADREWLFALHEQAHRNLVERAYGPWDDTQQRCFFAALVDEHDVFVIQAEDTGEEVGAVYLGERDGDVWLELVEVLPAVQGHGHGTAALRWVVERAASSARSTLLQVHRVNEGARRLYLTEGFVEVDESATHHVLRKTVAVH